MGIVLGPIRTIKGSASFKDKLSYEFSPGGSANSVANPPTGVSQGVQSLFNPYSVVVFPSTGGDNNKLIDGESTSGNFTPLIATNPSIVKLVEDNELRNKTPYYYTDFLYCKYNKLIPNNQLVTLRRFPAPTFDNLAVPSALTNPNKINKSGSGNSTEDIIEQKEFFPIAQAVTWFGEQTGNKLSDILSFGVNLNWKNVEAEVNIVSGNEQGSDDSPLPGAAKFIGMLTGSVNTNLASQNSQYDPYSQGPYSHRVYGPVNTISKTYKRDRGLDFKQTITLNFEYSLKSIGNINPKAAFLDLMSNLLALTYNNAGFWGGANRYFPQKPTYPFLGGAEGMNAWYSGQPGDFANSVKKQISTPRSNFMEILGKLGEGGAGALETLKGIANGVKGAGAAALKLGMTEMKKGRAPDILAIKALLTGEPIGEWHMVIGNPYAPISKVGNLICTESKFQFNDIIGADNFPTELKLTVTLEHGRPRDKGDIESMFNEGQGRIYYPPKGTIDQLNISSATRNSSNDTSWKTGSNQLGLLSKANQKIGLFTGSVSDFNNIVGSVTNTAGQLGADGKKAWKVADLMFDRTVGSVTNNGGDK